MTGRKSSRGAAVVLAGCVGLALVAPGLAVAQDSAPTDPCVPSTLVTCGGTDSGSGGSGSGTGSTTPETGTPAPTTTPPSGTTSSGSGSSGSGSAGAGTSGSGTSGTGGAGTDSSGTGATGSGTNGTGTNGAGGTGTNGTGGTGTTGTGTSGSAAATPAITATPTALASGATDVQNQLAALLPGLPTVPGLPTAPGNLTFPSGFVVPPSIPANGFTNPQQACAFLAGSVTVPQADAAGLGAAFAQFCGALPTSFDPSGLGGLTDLLDQLKDLLGGLVPTLPGSGTGTVIGDGTIPAAAPDYAHGYWSKRYDVDCDDLSGDEAQAIYDADRSDPFRLDGDDDGAACENNANVVNVNNYSGYPKGGVSTGDGSAATQASPAEVALAAMSLSFLALGGVALVRRFALEA